MRKFLLLCVLAVSVGEGLAQEGDRSLSLNGTWEYGLAREYSDTTRVPGIVLDPAKTSDKKLWYRRRVTLPEGEWRNAVLELKGARFRPEVYVDGQLVSSQNGGMIASVHPLKYRTVKPGATVTLEVALAPLSAVPAEDASFIPKVDQWRSNRSSCLWDDVVLHFDAGARVTRAVPWFDLDRKTVRVKYDVEGTRANALHLAVYDRAGREMLSADGKAAAGSNEITFSYGGILKEWTPDEPNLYTMELTLRRGTKTIDVLRRNLGIKVFSAKDKQFYLNGKPCKVRGGTVVWHRWVRDAEGRDVGFDTTWFRDNVVLRLKEHGANLLRFHLGVPPERLLDLCDRYGLLVQYEWNFFHGMPASYESLMEQYPKWFDHAAGHPSVALYHPYNETNKEELETAWKALDKIVKEYPPMVMEDRDVLHLHKYWWSLFEDIGLHYDSADQFRKAIMVDEFGGNYLDGSGNPGGYTTLKETFLRFLGRGHTKEERLRLQELSNGKIAEYWRRLGAAGVAPFTIASSWEDGNTWFMGRLREERPKPVWNALTVLWSPRAVSMDIWDRDFVPEQTVTVPLHFFNDTGADAGMKAVVTVTDAFGKCYFRREISRWVSPWSKVVADVRVKMPAKRGGYLLRTELINPTPEVKYPVVSDWDVRVLEAVVPEAVRRATVMIPDGEKELRALAEAKGLNAVSERAGTRPDAMMLSRASWEKIAAGDGELRNAIRSAIDSGVSVLLLDAGERYLGPAYNIKGDNLGDLQGATKVADPRVTRYELFDGFSLTFTETAEPESHIQPDAKSDVLWNGMPHSYTWLWNGLKGGLIVPAADMQVHGMNRDALLEQWRSRGADPERIRGEKGYYAYELAGFYEYSDSASDKMSESKLRERVAFLVEDAPALAMTIDPKAKIRVTDLCGEYQASAGGMAKNFTVLVNAGKNLTRTPVILVDFGEGKGRMILSQLLTAGRLAEGFGEPEANGIRYDEAAVQMTLNMLAELLKK